MYITRIQLKNIRGFADLDLNLTEDDGDPRMHTLIIGKNGTGKSTLLRSIALGVASRSDVNALAAEPLAGRLRTHTSDLPIAHDGQSEISISLQDHQHVAYKKTKFIGDDNGIEILTEDGSEIRSYIPQIFLCGYGVGRSNEGVESGRDFRIADSAYTLFSYDATLIQPELVLRRLRDFLRTDRRYRRVLENIKIALGLTPDDDIDLPRGGGVTVSGPTIGAPIPLEAWADGYRMTLTWMLDLYAWAMRAEKINEQGEAEGILLVDELEQHLHPSMQTFILQRLRKLFPKMQLIATTHSPLVVLGSSSKSELIVLRRRENIVEVVWSIPDFTKYSAEDVIVAAELFEGFAYSPEIEKIRQDYEELAKKPLSSRTVGENRKWRALSRQLSNARLSTPDQGPVAEAITKLRRELGLPEE